MPPEGPLPPPMLGLQALSSVGDAEFELENVVLSFELLCWCCSIIGLGIGCAGDDDNGEDEPAAPEPFVIPDPPEDRANGPDSFTERAESEIRLPEAPSRVCSELREEAPCCKM